MGYVQKHLASELVSDSQSFPSHKIIIIYINLFFFLRMKNAELFPDLQFVSDSQSFPGHKIINHFHFRMKNDELFPDLQFVSDSQSFPGHKIIIKSR